MLPMLKQEDSFDKNEGEIDCHKPYIYCLWVNPYCTSCCTCASNCR